MRPTYLVAIDTETTTDAAQRLLFGAWRYCRLDWIDEVPTLLTLDEGLFYEDELATWDPEGYEVLRAYVQERWSAADRSDPEAAWQLRLQDRQSFVEDVLWRAGYEKKAHLVFFNAGFDISRIAIGVVESRAGRRQGNRPRDRRFLGGFTFHLWPPGLWRPRIKIKHLDSKRALKRFGSPLKIDPENLDEYYTAEEDEPASFAGHILDCRTLAFALTNEGHSLESACAAFGAPYVKREVEHGRITPEYIDYCREDVEATAELCRALLTEYARHPIELQPTRAFSPASIAKGYLRAMGISPPMQRLGEVPEAESWQSVMGYAMTSYFGGRTETRVRRIPVPVVVLDFKSQYPTVCRLLDAWSLLTAEKVDAVEDDPAKVRAFVEELPLEGLFDPAVWKDLFAICQVEPSGEVLPVRARYDEYGQIGIGVNPYRYDAERLDLPYPWYALPDVVASKLLGSDAPRIRRVIRFVPKGTSQELKSTRLRRIVPVDPSTDDFFRSVIEERERRNQDQALPETERKRLDTFLKVLANSAGYGIYAEVNRTELAKRGRETVDVFGLRSFSWPVRAPEQAGEFFFAPLAAVVTASGRLLLAMLESEVASRGGTYAACDTDSAFVVATEDGTSRHGLDPKIPVLSWDDVRDIQSRFNALSPFNPEIVPDLLKAERDSLEREMWCYAISAKRYVLYRDAPDGPVVEGGGETLSDEDAAPDAWDVAKPSQHGLGHLLNPTDPESPSQDWIDEGWRWLMALDSGFEVVEPKWLDRPAVSQVSVSTPSYWRLFDAWNEGKSYGEGIKPFGFMMVAYADPLHTNQDVGRLIHAYELDPRKWLKSEWADLYKPDKRYRIGVRRPGVDVSQPGLVYVKTYRDVLYSYLGHPESKSIGSDGEVCRRSTKGRLGRRAVSASMITHIGKEANRLEERLAGLVSSEEDFLLSLGDDGSWERLVVPAARLLGFSRTSAAISMPPSTLADLISLRTKPQKRHETALRRVTYRLSGEWLAEHDALVPHDAGARLSAYVPLFTAWRDQVDRDYKRALETLTTLKVRQPGVVASVARAAGVARRRVWDLRDPEKRGAVTAAVAMVLLSEEEGQV